MFGKDEKGWCEALKEEESRTVAGRYCCTLILTAQKGNAIPRLVCFHLHGSCASALVSMLYYCRLYNDPV